MEKIGHVMKLSVLVLLLLLGGSASGHRSKSTSKIQSTTQQQDFSGEIPEDHEFFLKQIFDKYGHQGVISFEVSDNTH
ncbi:hypothetical protein C0J52_15621 [Blattella germanica]|nr:hypothetical protein C0J52_15621 [Blattella germanica]